MHLVDSIRVLLHARAYACTYHASARVREKATVHTTRTRTFTHTRIRLTSISSSASDSTSNSVTDSTPPPPPRAPGSAVLPALLVPLEPPSLAQIPKSCCASNMSGTAGLSTISPPLTRSRRSIRTVFPISTLSPLRCSRHAALAALALQPIGGVSKLRSPPAIGVQAVDTSGRYARAGRWCHTRTPSAYQLNCDGISTNKNLEAITHARDAAPSL